MHILLCRRNFSNHLLKPFSPSHLSQLNSTPNSDPTTDIDQELTTLPQLPLSGESPLPNRDFEISSVSSTHHVSDPREDDTINRYLFINIDSASNPFILTFSSEKHRIDGQNHAKQRLLIGLYGILFGLIISTLLVLPTSLLLYNATLDFFRSATQDQINITSLKPFSTAKYCVSPALINSHFRGFSVNDFFTGFTLVIIIFMRIFQTFNLGTIVNSWRGAWIHSYKPFVLLGCTSAGIEIILNQTDPQMIDPHVLLFIRVLPYFIFTYWSFKNITEFSPLPPKFAFRGTTLTLVLTFFLLIYITIITPLYYSQISENYKFFIRIVLHPILSEICLLSLRIFSEWIYLHLGINSSPHYWTVGTQLTFALYGRFLISSIHDPWLQYLSIILISIEDISLRATTWYRDDFYYWYRKDNNSRIGISEGHFSGNMSPIHYHFYFADEIAESVAIVVNAAFIISFNIVDSHGILIDTTTVVLSSIFSLFLEIGLDAFKSFFYFSRYGEKYSDTLVTSTSSLTDFNQRISHESLPTKWILHWLHLDMWIDFFWKQRETSFILVFLFAYGRDFLYFLNFFMVNNICFIPVGPIHNPDHLVAAISP